MKGIEFNIRRKQLSRQYSSLRKMLESSSSLGLDLSDVIEKLDNVVNDLNDDIIKIVLLGSFSDGKTTTIAGLLGRLESNMKIDTDESSDELSIYRPSGDRANFEIVDTPGLFGEKTKEVSGKEVKYSQITERYISEAHIIIYVTQAVSPLKDSHIPIIKKILRDYQKLASTIFVLNRMDDICDMEDEDDYKRTAKIKTQFLVNRLRQSISLSQEEEQQLMVICVAANPYGESLSEWFKKPDEYLSVSKISHLREAVNTMLSESDTDELQNSKHDAVIMDLTQGVCKELLAKVKIGRANCEQKEDIQRSQHDELKALKREVDNNREQMKQEILEKRKSVITDITSASSLSSFIQMVDSTLGMEDKKGGKKGEKEVTCNVLISEINTIYAKYSEANSASCSSTSVRIEQNFKHQENYTKGIVQLGVKGLGKVKVTGEMVKATRDVVRPAHKFKPWGAKKLGANITKWAGRLAIAINVAIEAWEIWQNYRDAKKLDEAKTDLKGGIEDMFKGILEDIDSDYYEKFAPSYIELKKHVEEIDADIAHERELLDKIHLYEEKLSRWKANATTVDYEEV